MRLQPFMAEPPTPKAGVYVPLDGIKTAAFRIPTSSPESDGTLEWDSTTLITVNVSAGGMTGFGYTYASKASAVLIEDVLHNTVLGLNAFDIALCQRKMLASVRNLGVSGIAACAIAAIDNALWDLKAKLLQQPIIHLLGAVRENIAVYGSGGFTSYGPAEIERQIDEWCKQGITLFKIKIGRNTKQDQARINAALKKLPTDGKLFVDANGAYHSQQALEMAKFMDSSQVAWFEEPVQSDDIVGMKYVRDHAPAGMDIAAGEYGFDLAHFHRLLAAEAVDILQADATRCLGVTGFLKAAALGEIYHRPLSSHCAPALHVPLMCHVSGGIHLEYFWDHVRIENMLFEGSPAVQDGILRPQTQLPGFGIIFKACDAEKYKL